MSVTPNWIAETPRLMLREIVPDDAEQAYLLNLDPEVVKYTGDKPFASVDEARLFWANYEHYGNFGFGRWAVIRKADGEWLGWCGLKYVPEFDEYDIGFRFFRRHWGQGYATEAAQVCLALGFRKFGMNEIVGRAMKENIGSINVLEKIGMQYHSEFELALHPGELYKISRETFFRLYPE